MGKSRGDRIVRERHEHRTDGGQIVKWTIDTAFQSIELMRMNTSVPFDF
jgi:hypothetical protein